MATIQVQFMYGIGFTYNDRTITDDDRALYDRAVVEAAVEWFGGASLVECKGGWRDPNGRIVTEPGRILTVLLTDKPASVTVDLVNQFAQWIGEALSQHTVLVSRSDVSLSSFENPDAVASA